LPPSTSLSSILSYLESVLGMTSSRKWNSELMKSLLYAEHLQVIGGKSFHLILAKLYSCVYFSAIKKFKYSNARITNVAVGNETWL